MKLITYCTLFCFALGAALARPALAQKADPFQDDRRLDQPTTLIEPMVTLEAVLKTVQERCGVELVADPGVEADTVAVIAHNRPVREVLQQLGLALGYSWSKRGSEPAGYRLFESEAARAKTRTLARDYRRAAGTELEQQLKLTLKYLEKYQGMESRDVIAEINRLREQTMQLPLGRERLLAEWDQFAAERAHEPTVKALMSAFLVLPPTLREQVMDGHRISMASVRSGSVRMPPEVLASLRASRQFEAVRATRGNEVPNPRQTEDEVIDFLTGMRFGRLVLQIRGRRLGDLRARPGLSLPGFVLSPSQVTYGTPLADSVPGEVVADDPKLLEQRIRFTWPGKKLVKEEPLSYCRGILLSDVLKLLVEQAPSLHFVGDAYFKALRPLPVTETTPGVPGGFDPASGVLARLSAKSVREGGLSLGELLRELANRGNTNIHVTRDGWVRFRSTAYFNDRAGQLDPRTVSELYAGVAGGEPYTPAIAMRVAQRLTYPQVEALTAEYLAFLPELRPVWRMRSSWDSWRLIGTLSEESRKRLFARQILRYNALTPAERNAVGRLINDVSSRIGGEALDLDVPPLALQSLTLTLGTPEMDGSDTFELWLPDFKDPLLRQSLQVQPGVAVSEKPR